MTWYLIIILTTGGNVAAEQRTHDDCLKGVAQVTLEPGVKVAYCIWRKVGK